MARRHFGSVRKLPSGRWQASYWHDGRRHAATETFRATGDALAWLATKEADIVRGTWVAPPTGKVNFGDYSLTWLQRQGHLRPRTRELYEFLLRKHTEPTFGRRPLTAITNCEVVAWYRSLVATVPGTESKCSRLRVRLWRRRPTVILSSLPSSSRVLRENTSSNRRSRRRLR